MSQCVIKILVFKMVNCMAEQTRRVL
uniref:Uncharacterized protein n=1 Tax=Anguilla anguilla TaxID=7936 RepID=A0A0E9T598_ANGAN